MDEAKIRSPLQPIALIPAFRPPCALLRLVDQILEAQIFAALYIVDDGSEAEYSGLFSGLKSRGVVVLRHHVNLGKGMALRTGLNLIAAAHPHIAGVVTFDADGQHLPNDIVAVSRELSLNPDALVLGTRKLSADAPLRSRVGNAVTRRVLAFFIGSRLADTQTGLRGIPVRLIPDLLRLKSVGYDFELDMLITAHRQGLKICQIPIQTVYIDGNSSSHFNPALDSMKIYFVFLRYSSVSLLTALIDYVVFAVAFLGSRRILLSMLLARSMAATFQFLMSYSFVFKAKQDKWLSIIKYLIVLGALTATAFSAIRACDEWLGVSPLISKVFIEGTIFIVSFLLLRDFVFAPADSD